MRSRIRPLKELEREAILEALEGLSWDKPRAAKALGISLNTLYNRLRDYGLGTGKPREEDAFFSPPAAEPGQTAPLPRGRRLLNREQFQCQGCGHVFFNAWAILVPTHCKACQRAMGEVRDRYFPLQRKAHLAVKQAISRGELSHPDQFNCVDCGDRAQCYDHRDYRKPLEVDPVCTRCNILRGPAMPYIHIAKDGSRYRMSSLYSAATVGDRHD